MRLEVQEGPLPALYEALAQVEIVCHTPGPREAAEELVETWASVCEAAQKTMARSWVRRHCRPGGASAPSFSRPWRKSHAQPREAVCGCRD